MGIIKFNGNFVLNESLLLLLPWFVPKSPLFYPFSLLHAWCKKQCSEQDNILIFYECSFNFMKPVRDLTSRVQWTTL